MKLFIIILLFVVILYFIFKKNNEGFEENIFDAHVISLKKPVRLKNIEDQQAKINIPIQILDAVKGDDLNLDDLIESGIVLKENTLHNDNKVKMREIGCYLSHIKMYETINKNYKYTILFEDDFNIVVPNLLEKITESIAILNEKNIDFDIMYLGNHNWNTNFGTFIQNDLYKLDNNPGGVSGTQGYVIHNKNIHKIIKNMKPIDKQIDIQIQQLANQHLLNVISTYPYIVTTIDTPSDILM